MAKKPKKKKSQPPTILALQRPESVPVESDTAETLLPFSPSPDESPQSAQAATPISEFQHKEEQKDTNREAGDDSAINAMGERFVTGDKIVVTAPWGGKAIATITSIYHGTGGTWVKYTPLVSEYPVGWNWSNGVRRAEQLEKVDENLSQS